MVNDRFCIHCRSEIDVINKLIKGMTTGLIPRHIIENGKAVKNKKDLMVCYDCMDHHMELLENI